MAGSRSPRRLVAAVLAAVALAACGTPRSGETVVSTPAELPSADVLAAGLSAYQPDVPVRVSMSIGQTMRMPALKVDTSSSVDLDAPMMVLEDDRSGRRHYTLDMSTMLAPILQASGLDPAAGSISTEMWSLPDSIVMDTSGFAGVDVPPLYGALFDPGLAVIDLGSATDDERAAMLGTLVGNSVTDPAVLATRLPATVGALEPDPADPTLFRTTATFADLMEALGGDVDNAARSAAAGFATQFGLGIDEVAEFYRSFYERLVVDLTVHIRNGVVTDLAYTADMSSLFGELANSDMVQSVAGGVDPEALEEAFGDVTWLIESAWTFQIVPSLVVEPPPGPYDDRTADAQAYVRVLNGSAG